MTYEASMIPRPGWTTVGFGKTAWFTVALQTTSYERWLA